MPSKEFDTALQTAVQAAQQALPQNLHHIEKARDLLADGMVEILPSREASVTDNGTCYIVSTQGVCTCPLYKTVPEHQCPHRLARSLFLRAMDAETGPSAQKPAPAAIPRAAPVPRPPLVTGNLVGEEQERSARICQAALDATPPAYQPFLMFLKRSKRVGGSKATPLYAEVENPYMGVDGRVKMAMDEHREKGATLCIDTTFATEPVTGHLLCRAVLTSSLLGMFTGHARAFVGGTGVDATNPLENAESSAIGRALGFMGYGLYGTGIASAEEVVQARAAEER